MKTSELHYELHLVITPSWLDTVGLPLPTDTEFCITCSKQVADTDERWVPYALVLHSTGHHNVCFSCIDPVLRGPA
jgi:hypothetical protein